MKRSFFLVMMIFSLCVACVKPSADPDARANRLGEQIRCPVCRGVSIAASPSALAKEMMDVVRQQIAAGKSDEEVLKYFEDRYGEWVLLKPKAEGMNYAIWILPALVLVGGGLVIVLQLRKRKG